MNIDDVLNKLKERLKNYPHDSSCGGNNHCNGIRAGLFIALDLLEQIDSKPPICTCKEPHICKKPYCTVCGRDIYPPPEKRENAE